MINPKKITNAGHGTWVANEYSSVNPFSPDNFQLLLVHQDHFALHFGSDYSAWTHLPILASEAPRWIDKDTLCFLSGNKLVVASADFSRRTEREFSEYDAIGDGGEADLSEDRNHRVLVGTRNGTREIFIYEFSTDTKRPVLSHSGGFNNLLITPDNHVLIDGQFLWDGIGNVIHQVFGADSHKSVTRYQGREVLIASNADIDPTPSDPAKRNAICMVFLDTLEVRYLLALDWDQSHRERDLAVHISCPQREPWCLVTTYAPKAPDYKHGYYNSISRIYFDGREPEVLCYHGSTSADYTRQPKASVSRDGSRFVYASDEGNPPGPVNTWLGLIGDGGAFPETDGPFPPTSPLPPPPLPLEPEAPIITTPVILPPAPQPPKPPVKKRGFWAWLLRLFGGR